MRQYAWYSPELDAIYLAELREENFYGATYYVECEGENFYAHILQLEHNMVLLGEV